MDYSRFNLNNNHPLIPSDNNYVYEKKYVSINSQDRDILKYPNPASFEIELPQDYLNVKSIRLTQWALPQTYSVFTVGNNNIGFVFKMADIYNPAVHGVVDPLASAIYTILQNNIDSDYVLAIEEGTYSSGEQMAKEMQNKMNEAITNYLADGFEATGQTDILEAFKAAGGYTEFVVAFNAVSSRLYFGNRSSGFSLPNDSYFYQLDLLQKKSTCLTAAENPSFTNWGLPSYLGFTRCPVNSIQASIPGQYRFYYGDVFTPGDNGFWITPNPNLPGSSVFFLKSPLRINLDLLPYVYLVLNSNVSLNCVDETSLYNLSTFTQRTNQTNSVVNSFITKINYSNVNGTNVQLSDSDTLPYKYFDPPIERIRRLNIKFKYHNNDLVDFNSGEWSITLEFLLMRPQIARKLNAESSRN
jgi:hypothetical protein